MDVEHATCHMDVNACHGPVNALLSRTRCGPGRGKINGSAEGDHQGKLKVVEVTSGRAEVGVAPPPTNRSRGCGWESTNRRPSTQGAGGVRNYAVCGIIRA